MRDGKNEEVADKAAATFERDIAVEIIVTDRSLMWELSNVSVDATNYETNHRVAFGDGNVLSHST